MSNDKPRVSDAFYKARGIIEEIETALDNGGADTETVAPDIEFLLKFVDTAEDRERERDEWKARAEEAERRLQKTELDRSKLIDELSNADLLATGLEDRCRAAERY